MSLADRRLGARQHLRRQIQGCAHDSPADARRLGSLLARTEVHENQPSAFLAHHVLSLDVSMHQTGVVHGRQGSTELVPDEPRLAGAERAVADEHLLERQAANEFHPETDSTVVFTGAVHRDDIRVPHTSQRLALRATVWMRAARRPTKSGPQELDGDGPIELRVVGAIDRAERAWPTSSIRMSPPHRPRSRPVVARSSFRVVACIRSHSQPNLAGGDGPIRRPAARSPG